eukprot:CAMPEP_0179001736 /NCGR_PEP_ID=MMETSP0795-20121207/11549_1 /TAXON_ID=88552 /ORGANISM="Amoebophrya sp., Strain Ameob2" /LENGTH=92 /DNA_ID=CAMNT_0020695189 /DNA_START=16 /DNA_END=290 /DNA_ORIENTATION=+
MTSLVLPDQISPPLAFDDFKAVYLDDVPTEAAWSLHKYAATVPRPPAHAQTHVGSAQLQALPPAYNSTPSTPSLSSSSLLELKWAGGAAGMR